MTNLSIPNVLNAKALEKQLKLVDTRLSELHAEADALNRIKEACQLLLGSADTSTAAKAETTESTTKKASPENLHSQIEEILKQKATALTIDDITLELKETGVSLPDKKAAVTVASTLKKHPEIFSQTEDEKWMIGPMAGTEIAEDLTNAETLN